MITVHVVFLGPAKNLAKAESVSLEVADDVVLADLRRLLAERYMGGKGFGARVLFDRLPPRCDPLSPENILVFATGPLTGTLAPSSGRFEVCTKSPATGLWLDANCGGFFGPELKFAGYDMIIVTGKSASPVLLAIDDDSFELKPAAATSAATVGSNLIVPPPTLVEKKCSNHPRIT